MASSFPTPPPPDTVRERLRDWRRSAAQLNNPAYWLVTRGAWWCVGFVVLYLLSGALLGWVRAYEVLLGITSPVATPAPVLAWPLSLMGWLLVPAFVGGVSGYLVSRQVDNRRTEDQEDFIRRTIDQVVQRTQGGGG